MYPSRPQTSLVFALPLLTRRVLLCSVLLRVTERLEQASFVIKRDEKLSIISFIAQTDAFKHERNTISVPGLQFVLFCFCFFFNFRSHSPLPFFFSRTRVCISILYVMKIVYLSTLSGMREIRNSWKGRALLTRLPDLFKSSNKSSASFNAELTTALCVVV